MKPTLSLALATSLALAAFPAFAQSAPSTAGADVRAPVKVLRYAFPVAETGFDPAQITDLYSRTVTANIFESPLTYDYLARPARIKPQTAAAMPEISSDFRRFVFRIRPGIHFADDPAFKGQRRELVAADYVYSIKRYYDPQYKSPSLFLFENAKVLGLSELRRRAIADRTPFPYDTEVAGLRTLDRYTFEVVLAQPAPRFHYYFADPNTTGAVAREVVEAYPGKAMEHPVGTGPFRADSAGCAARKIVLARNPQYRDVRYDRARNGDGRRARRCSARFKDGRRLPMIDQVEVSIIEENQPQWLSFLNGEIDALVANAARCRNEFAPIAVPNGKLAPNLARRGVQTAPRCCWCRQRPWLYFNMEHPVVGGYTRQGGAAPRHRLAYDVEREIRLCAPRPGGAGAEPGDRPAPVRLRPGLPSEMSGLRPGPRQGAARPVRLCRPQRRRLARAARRPPPGAGVLGHRARPAVAPAAELWQKALNAINVRIEFKIAQWPEQPEGQPWAAS
jgi:ABC-type oligopeptide transport system substrate-binding subunit